MKNSYLSGWNDVRIIFDDIDNEIEKIIDYDCRWTVLNNSGIIFWYLDELQKKTEVVARINGIISIKSINDTKYEMSLAADTIKGDVIIEISLNQNELDYWTNNITSYLNDDKNPNHSEELDFELLTNCLNMNFDGNEEIESNTSELDIMMNNVVETIEINTNMNILTLVDNICSDNNNNLEYKEQLQIELYKTQIELFQSTELILRKKISNMQLKISDVLITEQRLILTDNHLNKIMERFNNISDLVEILKKRNLEKDDAIMKLQNELNCLNNINSPVQKMKFDSNSKFNTPSQDISISFNTNEFTNEEEDLVDKNLNILGNGNRKDTQFPSPILQSSTTVRDLRTKQALLMKQLANSQDEVKKLSNEIHELHGIKALQRKNGDHNDSIIIEDEKIKKLEEKIKLLKSNLTSSTELNISLENSSLVMNNKFLSIQDELKITKEELNNYHKINSNFAFNSVDNSDNSLNLNDMKIISPKQSSPLSNNILSNSNNDNILINNNHIDFNNSSSTTTKTAANNNIMNQPTKQVSNILSLITPIVEDRLLRTVYSRYIADATALMNLTRFCRFAKEFDIIGTGSGDRLINGEIDIIFQNVMKIRPLGDEPLVPLQKPFGVRAGAAVTASKYLEKDSHSKERLIKKKNGLSAQQFITSGQFIIAIQHLANKLYSSLIEQQLGAVLEVLPPKQKKIAMRSALDIMLIKKIFPKTELFGISPWALIHFDQTLNFYSNKPDAKICYNSYSNLLEMWFEHYYLIQIKNENKRKNSSSLISNNSKKEINYKTLSKFSHDFDIVPNLLKEPQLYNIFREVMLFYKADPSLLTKTLPIDITTMSHNNRNINLLSGSSLFINFNCFSIIISTVSTQSFQLIEGDGKINKMFEIFNNSNGSNIIENEKEDK
jgi:hypothetical protein